LVPIPVREHHQIATADTYGFTPTCAVHPRLPTSNEVKDGVRVTAGIERPRPAVGALPEDPRAKA